MIVTGGENVLPAEVEEVLLRHPAVADAAVVGRADAEWQEAVTAVVVLRDGAEVERRRAALRTAPPSSPASRCRSGSSSSPSCRARRSGKLLRRASCDDRPRAGRRAGSTPTSRPGRATTREADRRRCSAEDVAYRYHPYDEPIRGRERGRRARGSRTTPTSAGHLRRRLRAGRGRRRRSRSPPAPAPTHDPDGSVRAVYDNCFLIRFDADGRCREFTEWFVKRPRARTRSIPRHA